MQTVFITGASSGIGKAAARLFSEKGWQVAATMRHPERETELPVLPNVRLFTCDVTDFQSIERAVQGAIGAFGQIHVLVNNAGYDAVGPLEGASEGQIRSQIETNLLGTVFVTRAMLPYFRENGGGTLINLSSVAGRLTMPLQSLYHASKWGVEGFSESLQFELKPFGIHVRLIEPGIIKTDFYNRSIMRMDVTAPEPYRAVAGRLIKTLVLYGQYGSDPAGVAQTIYRAATDRGARLRYAVGKGRGVLWLQKLVPGRLLRAVIARFSSR
ncbi:MAG: SDR family oxidoreductase [Christensenella sp.]